MIDYAQSRRGNGYRSLAACKQEGQGPLAEPGRRRSCGSLTRVRDTLGGQDLTEAGILAKHRVHEFMEDAMAARTTRQEARERILRTMTAALDRIIPPEGQGPLKGATFLDWENQTEEFKRAVVPTILEERAALDEQALVACGGHCPFCSSDSVYLEKQTTSPETTSPDGPVLIPKQHCRCRNCGGSFSPSGPCLGSVRGSETHAQGGGAVLPRSGAEIV